MQKTENKRTLAVLWVLLGIVVLTIIMSAVKGMASEKMMDDYDKALNSVETKLIYIGRPTCTYCQQLEPILKDLSARYNFDYFYLNTDKLSQDQLGIALEKAKIDATTFGTPYLLIIKDGKKVASQAGLQIKNQLFNFLQENKVIAEDAILTFDNETMLSNYNQALASNEMKLIYAGGTLCNDCATVAATLKAFDTDYNLNDFTLNTDEMTGTQLNIELTKVGIVDIDSGHPYLFVVKNNKLVASFDGEFTEKNLFNFVKTYNLIPNDSELIIEKIGYNDFLPLFNSNESKIVVVGRVGCGFCEAAYPVLKELIKEYNLEINYLELTYLSTDEQSLLINNMGDIEGGSTLSTPNMLIVKNGKVLDNSIGFVSKDAYIKFLSENGLLVD